MFWEVFYRLLVIVVIVFVTIVVARCVSALIDRFLHNSYAHFYLIKKIVKRLVYFMGFMFILSMIPYLECITYSLLASSGIIALVVGLASQQVVSNIINGVLISMSQPFNIGDRIKVGTEEEGVVQDITLRYTILKTHDNRRLLIPHAHLNDHVIKKN